MINKIKILFFIGAFLIGTTTFGQKFKIKDNVIIKDDMELGKVTGKSGLIKANFQIYTMSGEKILSIQRDEFVSSNPFYVNRYWYNIHFEDSGKDMMLPMSVEFSIKSVLNKTLPDAGIVIDGAAIKNQDEIIAKSDITDSIAKDTVDAVRNLKEMKALIQGNTIQRNMNAQIIVILDRQYTSGDTTIVRWNVIQDQKEVGAIVRKITKDIGTRSHLRYIIYEKISEGPVAEVPVALVREIIDYGPSDTPAGHTIECITVVDNITHKINLGTEYTATWSTVPVNLMAAYLVSKRYL